jgi:hypothetical protein
MSYHKIKEPRPSPNRSHRDRFVIAASAPAVAIVKVPTLKHGNDAKAAKQLNKLIKDAESGVVRILKAGFFLECLAEDLPHGMLGPWVESHCNREWRTVRRWKQVAAGVGDVLGITLKQRLEYKLHEVLALPLKKVPAELLAVREKIDAEIAGKSYRQLFLELKQVDEENPTQPKRGRLPGSSGLTKEMRELAAQREEEERLHTLAEETTATTEWLRDHADAKNLGMMDGKLLAKLQVACQTASGFIQRLMEARKGNGGAQ